MKKSEDTSTEACKMIETEVFRADRRRFALLLIERHGQGWLFGGFFLFILAIILGFAVDYRLFVLALLLVCLVAPALLMVMYYSYGMKGENFLNVLDHRIEIEEESLTLFLKVKGDEETGDGEVPAGEKDGKGLQREGHEIEEWREYIYPFESFGRYSVGKDYVVFPMLMPKEGFLYLPVDAFNNEQDFSEAVKRISKG